MKLVKILLLIGFLWLNGVLIFRVFLGYGSQSLGGPQIAIGYVALILSIFLLSIYLRRQKNSHKKGKTIRKVVSLDSAKKVMTFRKHVEMAETQIAKMDKKIAVAREMLGEKFDYNEMTFHKFDHTLQSAKELLHANIESMVHRISAFDDDDYGKRSIVPITNGMSADKKQIQKEYIDYVEKALESNEAILLKVDMLTLEISKLSSLDFDKLSSMKAMRDIDTLIEQSKLYK